MLFQRKSLSPIVDGSQHTEEQHTPLDASKWCFGSVMDRVDCSAILAGMRSGSSVKTDP